MAGRMSMNEAHPIPTGKAKPTSWDWLMRAWSCATEDHRARFLAALAEGERKAAWWAGE